MGIGRDVRRAVFDQTLSFSAREVSDFGAPSLITRSSNDVQQVQMLLLLASFMLVSAPMTAIGGVDVARRDPEVLWGQLALVPQWSYLFSGTVARNHTLR